MDFTAAGGRYAGPREPVRAKNLGAIKAAVDQHNDECPVPANSILLNPVDHALIDCDELWGLPVLADERVPTKRVRIQCDGSAFGIEDEFADAVSREQPAGPAVVVPVGPARERRRPPPPLGRDLQLAPEGAGEQILLARRGPARHARSPSASRSSRTVAFAAPVDVRLAHGLVAAALESSARRSRSRACGPAARVALDDERREGPRRASPLRW